MRQVRLRDISLILAPALAVLAGCGGGVTAANPSNSTFSISAGVRAIDTNCTGCNATTASGGAVEQFTAHLLGGGAAAVTWKVSGGDPVAGAGTITASGQYAPPSYLTRDSAEVVVTAALEADAAVTATEVVTVTPGFLQPLTPENAAVGANGSVTVKGVLAEAGGSTGINFSLADTAKGVSGGEGWLSGASCQRGGQSFTVCSVTYTAPGTVAATAATYVVARVGVSGARTSAAMLVNTAGVSSNPASHQAQLAFPVQMGSSSGNNGDFDLAQGQVVDCCGGTLGALLKGSDNGLYVLGNNHVLARSDHAAVGDSIVQPGLIDNNCTPNGIGGGTAAVGTLAAWLPLSSNATNVDAAIAQAAAGAVDASGSILELGGKQADGTLAAAPPGISSSGGKGVAASLEMKVAKSGRTTGLTCAHVSALDLDVLVDYFTDCAETRPYLTKTFSNQVGISGDGFSDAGDSGALVVDSGDAEPVGLFFAGGTDAAGVGQGVASPAGEVLSELGSQAGGATSYSFAGTADHAVSCLNYGDSSVTAAQARTLSDAEMARAQQGLAAARALVNPGTGILGVATGKSNDHPGEAAVIVYVDESMTVSVPAAVAGVRTMVIPTNAHAVAFGSAPGTNPAHSGMAAPAAALNAAIAFKQDYGRRILKQNPAFFGIGVGQSLDSPRDAALVIFVDRKRIPEQLPETVGGIRTRYVVMDRLHVTRSYATAVQPRLHCMPEGAGGFDPAAVGRPRALVLE